MLSPGKKNKEDGDPCRILKFYVEDLESYSGALASLPHEVGSDANLTKISATPTEKGRRTPC